MDVVFKETIGILKSKGFDSALDRLRKHESDWTARHGFRFLRTIAVQIKDPVFQKGSSFKESVQICSRAIKSDETLNEVDEIAQGLLAVYHLSNVFIEQQDLSTTLFLSDNIKLYIYKVSPLNVKDVQTILMNLSSQLGKATRNPNADSKITFRLRELAFTFLLHAGTSGWTLLVEQVNILVQSQKNLEMDVPLLQDILTTMEKLEKTWEKESDHLAESCRVQIWAILRCLTYSSRSQDSPKFTVKNLDCAKDFLEAVLYLTETHHEAKLEPIKKMWKAAASKNATSEVACSLYIRAGVVTTNIAQRIIRESLTNASSADISALNHFRFVADVLMEFYSKLPALKGFIQKFFGMSLDRVEILCLTRATSIYVQLLLKDSGRFQDVDLKKIFGLVDALLEKNKENKDKFNWILTCAEPSSYNAGIAFYKQNSLSEACYFFRKSMDYLIGYPEFVVLDEQANQKVASRLDTVYDSRRLGAMWSEFVGDFKRFLLHALWLTANQDLTMEKNLWLQKLLNVWTLFKRDLHLSDNPPAELLKLTVLDVLRDVVYSPLYPSQSELLFAELRAYDNKNGPFPRCAVLSAAVQAESFASTLQEKWIAQVYSLVDDSDPQTNVKLCRNLIQQLDSAVQKAERKDQQMLKSYLAVVHFQLHVAKEAIVKREVQEEIERIGPLLQSCNTNVPRGEDASSVLSSGPTETCALQCGLRYSRTAAEPMNRSLELWEQLLDDNWKFEKFSSIYYCNISSLVSYYALQGNNYFKTRACKVLLAFARDLQLDDVFLTAVAELLKLAYAVDEADVQKCESVVNKYTQERLDSLQYRIAKAYADYYKEDYTKSNEQLLHILKSTAFQENTWTKSFVVLKADALLLESYLLLTTNGFSKLKNPLHQSALYSALEAFQRIHSAYKSYMKYAEQHGWDYPGMEWHVVFVYIKCGIHLADAYSFTGCARETGHFLREVLQVCQKHALPLRVAEVILRLSMLDTTLNNAVNCQAKLASCYTIFGDTVAPTTATTATTTTTEGLTTPVVKKPSRSRTKKVVEAAVNLAADAGLRSLQMIGELPGASPHMRSRDMSEVCLLEPLSTHTAHCGCYCCSQELLYSLQCYVVHVQAKLTSLQGMDLQTFKEFQDRYNQLLHYILTKFNSTDKIKASRNLFQNDENSTNHKISILRRLWLQPVIRHLLELGSLIGHLLQTNGNLPESKLFVQKICSDVQQHVSGSVDLRLLKLISRVVLLRECQQRIGKSENEENVPEAPVENQVAVPPTPAWNKREITEPPKINRKNQAKKEVRCLLFDWEEGTEEKAPDFDEEDYEFHKKSKGKPPVLVIPSSDDEVSESAQATKPKAKNPAVQTVDEPLISRLQAVTISAQTPAPKTVRKSRKTKIAEVPEATKLEPTVLSFQTPAPPSSRRGRRPKIPEVPEEETGNPIPSTSSRPRNPVSYSRLTVKAKAAESAQSADADSPAFKTPAPATGRRTRAANSVATNSVASNSAAASTVAANLRTPSSTRRTRKAAEDNNENNYGLQDAGSQTHAANPVATNLAATSSVAANLRTPSSTRRTRKAAEDNSENNFGLPEGGSQTPALPETGRSLRTPRSSRK